MKDFSLVQSLIDELIQLIHSFYSSLYPINKSLDRDYMKVEFHNC
jgi:hypothetical protein